MKKGIIVLLFCACALPALAEKDKPFVAHPMYAKAAKYPMTFTVVSEYTVTATDKCWINLTDGDGQIYEVSDGPCYSFQAGERLQGRFHHYPLAGTDIDLLVYFPKKHKFEERRWTIVSVTAQ